MDKDALISFPQHIVNQMREARIDEVSHLQAIENCMHHLGHIPGEHHVFNVYADERGIATVEWLLKSRREWKKLTDIVNNYLYAKDAETALEADIIRALNKYFGDE